MVKYVVREIIPHFLRTFNGGIYGGLRSNRGVYNISESRTALVFQLPNQAPYQLGHTRITPVHYISFRRKKQPEICGMENENGQIFLRRWFSA